MPTATRQDYDEQLKPELQEELDRRGLPRSGTKDELIARLREDDREDDREDGRAADGGDDEASSGVARSDEERSGEDRPDGPSSRRPPVAAIIGRVRGQFAQVTGLRVEGVSRMEALPEGWAVSLEVLELQRVPRSTDVLASYDLDVNTDGDLSSWRRVRRYVRSAQEEF